MQKLYVQAFIGLGLVFLFMVYPGLVLAADTTVNPSPLTAAYTAGEWALDKLKDKPKNTFHSPERQARFDRWAKEDWIKDDPNACMWDRNWIYKNYKEACK
jgi:hypothetical protein